MIAESKYSAFIDLVGTRDLAKDDSQGYWRALGKFQEGVFDACDALTSRSSAVCFFSDCAFVESASFDEMTTFLRTLRKRLLQDHQYFKGAVKKGALEPREAHSHPLIKDLPRRRKDVLRGYWFNENAAALFSNQERLKGIGIWIEKDEAETKRYKDLVRLTCHVPESARGQASVYYDLALTPDETTKGNLQGVLSTFFDAKTRSKRYGRYYVSLLLLWIQSVPLDKIRYDPRSDEDLVNFILSGRFLQLYRDVIGIENVLFGLLNRAYREQGKIEAKLFAATRKYVLNDRRLLSSLQFVPPEILSTEVRRSCLGTVADSVLNRFEILQHARDRIVELRLAGKAPGEIARLLDDEGFATPRGHSWHANTVASVLREAGQ